MNEKQKKFDIIVVGEVNPDLILSGDVTPFFNQVEKIIDSAELTIGSSSCIFACGAAKLGLKVAFLGKVGNDDFGKFMISQLSSHGIDISKIIIDSEYRTGLSVILSNQTDRAILTYPGAISELYFEEIDIEFLNNSRHLHVGSYYLLEKMQQNIPILFSIAHELGLTTSLDTNYDPSEKWDSDLFKTLEHTDVFLPNETELLELSREANLDIALEKISGKMLVAVKRGALGGVAQKNNHKATASALSVNVLDTTGAGDSFDAGFIYGYLKSWNIEQSIRLACICGSLSTRGIGGTSTQPNFTEASSYLQSI